METSIICNEAGSVIFFKSKSCFDGVGNLSQVALKNTIHCV